MVSDVRSDVRHVSDVAYMNETVKIDTSKTAYFANELKNIVIEEDIIAIEYDTESGKPVKETTTKRKIVQDSDKVVAEEEQKRVEIYSEDSLNHIVDKHEMVDGKSETVTENHGLASVWERFGEVLGVGALVAIVYLCRVIKSKSNE